MRDSQPITTCCSTSAATVSHDGPHPLLLNSSPVCMRATGFASAEAPSIGILGIERIAVANRDNLHYRWSAAPYCLPALSKLCHTTSFTNRLISMFSPEEDLSAACKALLTVPFRHASKLTIKAGECCTRKLEPETPTSNIICIFSCSMRYQVCADNVNRMTHRGSAVHTKHPE